MPSPDDHADQTNPSAPYRKARFHSPHGGDPGVGGGPTSFYYNPKPAAAAKKLMLQNAAAKLYARHSITAFGLRAVAQAANLSPNTINYYYHDKDDLLADLLMNHVLAINAPVCAAFDATLQDPPHERMAALLAAFLNAVHANADAHRTLRLNAMLLGDAHRPRVVDRYRQILATLREALDGCVPALAEQPDAAKLLVRMVVGAMSESVDWFRDDGAMSAHDLAVLLAAQMLVSARALADGIWPAPTPIAPSPEPVVANPRRKPERDPTRGDALWIATETALNRWGQVSAAALSGKEVILAHRGWPLLQLIPATAQQQTMRNVTGRTGKRGRKARKSQAANADPSV